MLEEEVDGDALAVWPGAYGGSVRDVDEWPDRIRKVTADQVKAVAARYLELDHSITGYLMPQDRESM